MASANTLRGFYVLVRRRINPQSGLDDAISNPAIVAVDSIHGLAALGFKLVCASLDDHPDSDSILSTTRLASPNPLKTSNAASRAHPRCSTMETGTMTEIVTERVSHWFDH